MRKTAEQIEQIVLRQTNKGLLAGGLYLQARMKDNASVPAPRKRVQKADGSYTWKATTRATPGAPPRKITGSFRAKIMVRQPDPSRVLIGVFNDVRARPFETWMNHSLIRYTFLRERGNLRRIIGAEFGSRIG